MDNNKDFINWLFSPPQIIRLIISVTLVFFIISMMIGMGR